MGGKTLREQRGQGAEYLLVLGAVLVVAAIVVYFVTSVSVKVPSDREILERLDKDGPMSDRELYKSFNNRDLWSVYQNIQYYAAVDRLIAENYIRAENIYSYTMLNITNSGWRHMLLLGLEGDC